MGAGETARRTRAAVTVPAKQANDSFEFLAVSMEPKAKHGKIRSNGFIFARVLPRKRVPIRNPSYLVSSAKFGVIRELSPNVGSKSFSHSRPDLVPLSDRYEEFVRFLPYRIVIPCVFRRPYTRGRCAAG